MRSSLQRPALCLLLLAACAAAAASSDAPRSAPPRPARFGTLLAASTASLARRTAAMARSGAAFVPPPSYPSVTDAWSFTGPVPGLGFVEHTHDITLLNTTWLLDELPLAVAGRGGAPLLLGVACAADASAPARAPPPGSPPPMLPGEDASSGGVYSRRGVTVTLRTAAGSAATDALLHRAASAAHVLVGAGFLDAAPPACGALLGGTHGAPSYSLTAVHAVTAADGAEALTTLTLAPAPLLAGFAAASWRHVVDRDVARALEARGETLATHYPTSPSRELASWYLADFEQNWAAEANAGEGGARDALTPLGQWTVGPATITASCAGCFAKLTSVLIAELQFCAWARADLTVPQACLFGICTPSIKLATVGLGPLGVGCTPADDRERGVGFRIAMTVRHDASAAFGAGVQLRASAGQGLLLNRSATLFSTPAIPFTFAMLGIPVYLSVALSLKFSVLLGGSVVGELSTGSVAVRGSASHGFTFDSRRGLVPTQDVKMPELTQPAPPSAALSFGASSLRAELTPTVALVLYGFVALDAAIPVRLQADLAYVAPDAVLCDLPLCALPALGRSDDGSSLGLYVTWQIRLRVQLATIRLRDVVGIVPLMSGFSERFVSATAVLVPASTLLDVPITPRNLLFSACLPAVYSGGRALEAPAPAAAAAVEEGEAHVEEMEELELSVGSAAALRGAGGSRSLQTYTTCGSYYFGPGSVISGAYWSGTPCVTNGCGWWFGAGCITGSNSCDAAYQLRCPVGGTLAGSTSYNSICRSTSTANCFGCNAATYSFNAAAYCKKCNAGENCPGGTTTATTCSAGSYCTGGVSRQCTCGNYCPSGAGSQTLCPAGSYCPAGSAAPIACTGGGFCPAGSCSQQSQSPSQTATRTRTASQTSTATGSRTGTPGGTPSAAPTATASISQGATPSQTVTSTATRSMTPTRTAAATQSGTPPGTVTPSRTASPAKFASALPSCNRARVDGGPFLFATPPPAPTPATAAAFVAARLLVTRVTTLISLGNVPTPSDLLELSRLSLATYTAVCAVVTCGGGAPGYDVRVQALPRSSTGRQLQGGDAAADDLAISVSWEMQTVVASAPLAARDASLLTNEDAATFDDALYFAASAASSAAAMLTALVEGDDEDIVMPLLLCEEIAAGVGATAMGCAAPDGSGKPPEPVPFRLLQGLTTLLPAVGAAPLPANATVRLSKPVTGAAYSGDLVVYAPAYETGPVLAVTPPYLGPTGPSTGPSASSGGGGSGAMIAAAAGGAVAGLLVLGAVAALIIMRRRRSSPLSLPSVRQPVRQFTFSPMRQPKLAAVEVGEVQARANPMAMRMVARSAGDSNKSEAPGAISPARTVRAAITPERSMRAGFVAGKVRKVREWQK